MGNEPSKFERGVNIDNTLLDMVEGKPLNSQKQTTLPKSSKPIDPQIELAKKHASSRLIEKDLSEINSSAPKLLANLFSMYGKRDIKIAKADDGACCSMKKNDKPETVGLVNIWQFGPMTPPPPLPSKTSCGCEKTQSSPKNTCKKPSQSSQTCQKPNNSPQKPNAIETAMKAQVAADAAGYAGAGCPLGYTNGEPPANIKAKIQQTKQHAQQRLLALDAKNDDKTKLNTTNGVTVDGDVDSAAAVMMPLASSMESKQGPSDAYVKSMATLKAEIDAVYDMLQNVDKNGTVQLQLQKMKSPDKLTLSAEYQALEECFKGKDANSAPLLCQDEFVNWLKANENLMNKSK